MSALKFPKDVISAVSGLVALHLRFYGYGRGEWTDSAVRRYVTDAGDLLSRLHKLTRSDVTTRNRRKAAALAADYSSLEERIARIAGSRSPIHVLKSPATIVDPLNGRSRPSAVISASAWRRRAASGPPRVSASAVSSKSDDVMP